MKNISPVRIIGAFAALALFVAAYFLPINAEDFAWSYIRYTAAADAHERSAFLPGNEENNFRKELNRLLMLVLDEKISLEERKRYAEEGLDPLGTVRAQIDDMKEKGKEAENAIVRLRESSGGVGGIRLRASAEKVVASAERKLALAKEIAEVSYRMNDAIENIFSGIIEDRGSLSDDRIRGLNDDLPAAEKDFDRLNELYRELEKERGKTERLYEEFEDRAFINTI